MYSELYEFQNQGSQQQRKTIVVVDDDIEDLFLMKEALFESNIAHNIICLQNGQELLDFLHYRGKFEGLTYPLPYLIFLDFHMPKYSGLEVLDLVRKNPVFDDIKIVLLSHNQISQMATIPKEINGRCFTKPFHLKDYHHLISDLKSSQVIEA
jgi:CheY-like chemotaxis protein